MTRALRDLHSVGFSYLTDDSGRLDRRLPANLLFVPARVEAEKRRLIWTHQAGIELEVPPYSSKPAKCTIPGDSLLDDFLRLAECSGEAVARYARKWGILGICRHNLPRTHHRGPIEAGFCYETSCSLRTFKQSPEAWSVSGWEPLESWHRFARKAKSILDAASYLHRGEAVTEPGIAHGFDEAEHFFKARYKKFARSAQLHMLNNEVNRWLVLGNVRPLFAWSETDPPEISFGAGQTFFSKASKRSLIAQFYDWQGTSLFGALGMQILMTVSRQRGMAICSECGALFSPTKTPNPKRNRFCDDCGTRASWRIAQAKRRLKLARLTSG